MLRLFEIDDNGESLCPGTLDDLARSVCHTTREMYARTGFEPPWIGYLAAEDGQIVGTCAFKTAPHDDQVEIAYFTFPAHERRGVATQLARQLVHIARATNPELTVIAQTLPEENASTSILRKLGFAWAGLVDHPEDGIVWQWALGPNRDAVP